MNETVSETDTPIVAAWRLALAEEANGLNLARDEDRAAFRQRIASRGSMARRHVLIEVLAALTSSGPRITNDGVLRQIADAYILSVTAKPVTGRGHATPEAAAKRWGNEQGIVNAGGTLYWDVVPTSGHPARRKPFNLGVGRATGRGPLVTGYGHSGTNKGWLALATVLRLRGALVERDGRWFVVESPKAA